MWTAVIILLAISIILLIASYFKKDNTSNLQEEIEEISLDLYQENARLKERLAVIERELDIQANLTSSRESIGSTTEKQIVKLYTQGKTEAEIANTLNLNPDAVESIINQYISTGMN